VLVQAPPTVANFLVNEKRKQLSEIEARHDVAVIVVADDKLETPHLEITRLRVSEIGDEAKPSYQRVTPVQTAPLPQMLRPSEEPEQPAVAGVVRATPAPERPEPTADAPVPAKAHPTSATNGSGGFLSRLFGFFRSEPAAPSAPIVAKNQPTSRPAAQRSQPARDATQRPAGANRSPSQSQRPPRQDGQGSSRRDGRPSDSRNAQGQSQKQGRNPRRDERPAHARTTGEQPAVGQQRPQQPPQRAQAEPKPQQAAPAPQSPSAPQLAAAPQSAEALPERLVSAANAVTPEQAAGTETPRDELRSRRRGRRGGRRRRKGAGGTDTAAAAAPQQNAAGMDDFDDEDESGEVQAAKPARAERSPQQTPPKPSAAIATEQHVADRPATPIASVPTTAPIESEQKPARFEQPNVAADTPVAAPTEQRPAFTRPEPTMQQPAIDAASKPSPSPERSMESTDSTPAPVAPRATESGTPTEPRAYIVREHTSEASTAPTPVTPVETQRTTPTPIPRHDEPKAPVAAVVQTPAPQTAVAPSIQRDTPPTIAAPAQQESPRDRGHTLELPLSSPQSSPSVATANPQTPSPAVAPRPAAPARSDSTDSGNEETDRPEHESDNAA
jgi:ribonuclease E